MATSPYATPADLAAWIGVAVPTDGARLIRNACILLDANLIGFAYPTDANLNPTDAVTIQAFNDATCAQVEYWIQNGDEFGDGNNIASYSIEGASVTFRKPVPRLAPRAQDVLRVAGILPSVTPIHMP
jgi:hypothetical protein